MKKETYNYCGHKLKLSLPSFSEAMGAKSILQKSYKTFFEKKDESLIDYDNLLDAVTAFVDNKTKDGLGKILATGTSVDVFKFTASLMVLGQVPEDEKKN